MNVVFPALYAIIDPTLLKTTELAFAETMAESGVQLLQYRSKHASSRQLFEMSNLLSHRLASLARDPAHPIRFIVNDRPDIALLVSAGGVHVGQTDLGVEQTRAIMGREPWIGVSTHNLEQVAAADRTSADYIAFGPVFTTATKDKADPVVGLRLLAEARTRTSKPLVAIGGITLERAADTYRAGADSLAVARDLMVAPDPGAQARAFLKEAARTSSELPRTRDDRTI
jgi:thiamine-phosphate pyrophosphorylase